MNDRTHSSQDPETKAYEVHDETPTLTFVGIESSLTLPYIAFQTMRRDPQSGQLQLEMEGFRITLQGTHLRALWRDLQLYRVREIYETAAHQEPATSRRTVVQRISIEKMGED